MQCGPKSTVRFLPSIILLEAQELVSTRCNHVFYRTYISSYIETTSECPICRKLCAQKNLRQFILAEENYSKKEKEEGVRPSTRSQTEQNTKQRIRADSVEEQNVAPASISTHTTSELAEGGAMGPPTSVVRRTSKYVNTDRRISRPRSSAHE